MSTPEIVPDMAPQPDVAPKVEQPIVPETVQSLGVTAPPQTVKPIVADNNQVLVQPVPISIPVPTPSVQTLVVPDNVARSEKELEKGAEGPPNLSITWLDMTWLKEVHRAIMKGWKVVFGQKDKVNTT